MDGTEGFQDKRCVPLAITPKSRVMEELRALTYDNFRIGWQQQVGVNEINTGTAGCNRATLRGVARLGSGGLKGSPVCLDRRYFEMGFKNPFLTLALLTQVYQHTGGPE